uniref:Nudix hydrolase domain-containing protein n=1 Tax=Clytia hemisphaerica TaxID=252671 RepID=A0A7M5UGI0_9CNID
MTRTRCCFLLIRSIEILHQINFKSAYTSRNLFIKSRSFGCRPYSNSKTTTTTATSKENIKTMDGMEIKDMKLVPCTQSKYVVPGRVTFNQNGRQRKWDYVKVHDSVSILIYNKTRDAFVLVRQFRPAPYLNINSKMLKEEVSDIENKSSEKKEFKTVAPFELGVTYELCAGIVDQKRPLVEITKDAISQMMGYNVEEKQIKRIYQTNHVGYSGDRCDIYIVEVTDEMLIKDFKPDADLVEYFYLSRNDAQEFATSDEYVKNSNVIASILWCFLHNIF